MTTMTHDLAREMLACIEMHSDYDLPEDGFTRSEFVDWIMDGIGDDMVREGKPRDLVTHAAAIAYDSAEPRFRST